MSDSDPDMDDLIEAVTMYKCKFCDFQAPEAKHISLHIKANHATPKKSAPEIQESDNMASDVPASLPLMPVSIEEKFEDENLTDVSMKAEETLTSDQGISELIDNDDGVSMALLSDNNDDANTNLPPPPPPADAPDLIEAPKDENSVDASGHLAAGASPWAKDLFVCGECTMAFLSLDFCKKHMLRDHNISVDESDTPDQLIAAPKTPKKTSVKSSVVTMVPAKSSSERPKRKKRKLVQKKTEMQIVKSINEDGTEVEVLQQIEFEGDGESIKKKSDAGEEGGDGGDDEFGDDEDFEDSDGEKPQTSGSGKKKPKRKKREVRPFMEEYKLCCNSEFANHCQAMFKTEESLKLHQACHSKDPKEPGYVCVECNEKFLKWPVLRWHLWKSHDIDADLFTCKECNYRSTSSYVFWQHLCSHGKERPFLCDICGKTFKTRKHVRVHKMIHKPPRTQKQKEDRAPQKCQYCGRVLANKKCLQKHIDAVHNPVKKFVCQHCGYSASRKGHLTQHMRSHTGEKPYKCDMCPFAAKDSSSLRRHILRHNGIKPYKCPYCDYACVISTSFKTHMIHRHPGLGGLLSCDLCSFKTISHQALYKHKYDHDRGIVGQNKKFISPERTNRKAKFNPQAQGPDQALQNNHLHQLQLPNDQTMTVNLNALQAGQGVDASHLLLITSDGEHIQDIQVEEYGFRVVQDQPQQQRVTIQDPSGQPQIHTLQHLSQSVQLAPVTMLQNNTAVSVSMLPTSVIDTQSVNGSGVNVTVPNIQAVSTMNVM